MQRYTETCKETVQIGLKTLLNYAKQYTEGKRTQEELDLVIDKIVCVICSDVNAIIQVQSVIPEHTDFKEVSNFNVKDVMQTDNEFLRFIHVLRSRVGEHNELSKEGKTTLTVRDYLALATLQLYSMKRIIESKKLAKLLYDLEVIGGKYSEHTGDRNIVRQPTTPCIV